MFVLVILGAILLVMRFRVLRLANILEQRNEQYQTNGCFVVIGGIISIVGVLIFVIFVGVLINLLAEERHCKVAPDDIACLLLKTRYPERFSSSISLEAVLTYPFFLLLVMTLFLLPLYIGQLIVIVSAWLAHIYKVGQPER